MKLNSNLVSMCSCAPGVSLMDISSNIRAIAIELGQKSIFNWGLVLLKNTWP
jgi:hypothetical protein